MGGHSLNAIVTNTDNKNFFGRHRTSSAPYLDS
jgi:hypothetical protein